MTVWLLSWLWEGIALTTAVAMLLKVSRLNAATRHVIWWGVLAAVAWLGFIASPYGGLTPVPVRGSDPNGMSFAAEPLFYVPSMSAYLVSILLGIWAAIALVKLVRLIPALHAVYSARDRCRAFPGHLESQLPLWLETNEEGRRAELKICDAVPGATVLGFQRPCVALPASLVAVLTPDELDQILLHEHAHVRRWDDWARLVQAAMQAVLWIHPAVAYIGRAIDREREMACDEWVVARTGLPKAYARCLARAAELRARINVEPLLIPTLFSRQHDLVYRIERLLAVKGRTRRHVSRFAITTATVTIAVMSGHLHAVPLVGEYVEMVLPHVPPVVRIAESVVPAPAPSDGVDVTEPGRSANLQQVQSRESVEVAKPHDAFERYEPYEPYQPSEPAHAPVAVIDARQFIGAYTRREEAPVRSEQTLRWSAAAAPGVGIARAARKTSVGLAGAFTRAGVSVAKSF